MNVLAELCWNANRSYPHVPVSFPASLMLLVSLLVTRSCSKPESFVTKTSSCPIPSQHRSWGFPSKSLSSPSPLIPSAELRTYDVTLGSLWGLVPATCWQIGHLQSLSDDQHQDTHHTPWRSPLLSTMLGYLWVFPAQMPSSLVFRAFTVSCTPITQDPPALASTLVGWLSEHTHGFQPVSSLILLPQWSPPPLTSLNTVQSSFYMDNFIHSQQFHETSNHLSRFTGDPVEA